MMQTMEQRDYYIKKFGLKNSNWVRFRLLTYSMLRQLGQCESELAQRILLGYENVGTQYREEEDYGNLGAA